MKTTNQDNNPLHQRDLWLASGRGKEGNDPMTDNNVRRISVGEFRSVPAGQYAEEVLTNLGILAQLRSKLVFANNVRGVLAAVETGNADAGIVYATDTHISDQVRRVATAPSNLHSPIVYPGR